jgi:hexosaminidase
MKKVICSALLKLLILVFMMNLNCSTNAIAASLPDSEVTLNNLMPVPKEVKPGEGRFRLNTDFSIVARSDTGSGDRLARASTRFLRRLGERTGIFFDQGFVYASVGEDSAGLIVSVAREGAVALGEDESYQIQISASGLRIKAETDLGAMHGLETLLQLLSADSGGYYFPAVEVSDEPRFPWRGLMIDSARHFMPLHVIRRNIDAMSAMKMNVLHWHLTEDQGFRVEVKSYPRLHELGSDGLYYTQQEIKDLVAYAADRGIRVYPEFDVPGHATAWLVGHPELASAPGPYEIERQWGIFKPTIDPTNEKVYDVLEAVFTEMAALFPDPYFHIGGDEVEGHQWDNNKDIQEFMKANGLEDNLALQAYFNQRILKILTKLDKIMIGWDEILHPAMPENVVIHSWRGKDGLVAAAKAGHASVLSNGYYIDLMQPAVDHYLNDPLPEDIGFNDAEKSRIYGGEATMWSEHVTVETVDSRIWPRTAAIAERLWSPQEVKDVADMYRRLDIIAIQLEELGLTHVKNREMMMRRLTGGYDVEPLRVLADVVEPLKIYKRNAGNIYRSYSPYTLLPDIAVADAKDARTFRERVDTYVESGNGEQQLRQQLVEWKENHAAFQQLAADAPALREALPLSESLSELAALALQHLDGSPVAVQAVLDKSRQSAARVELQIVDAMETLFAH